MPKIELEIDLYIQNAADFAKPILIHFRDLMHKTCPELEEKIKWGFPHFDYRGGPMCSMAAFKQHCAIGFWKAALMKNGKPLVEKAKSEVSMGHLGRITSVKDLPSDKILKAFIREAMRLNEEGIKLKSKKARPEEKKELIVPEYFIKAISKNTKALNNFNNFSYSHKKEYLRWVSEAKTETTRKRRLETTLQWLKDGKDRNWKYKS